MSTRANYRWRLWLGVLVVAAGISVTLAIVLTRRPGTSCNQAMQQPSEGMGTPVGFASNWSVPRFRVQQEPSPVERAVPPGTAQTPSLKDLPSPVLNPPVQAEDPHAPTELRVGSLSESDLVRVHDIATRIVRMKLGTGSAGSGP